MKLIVPCTMLIALQFASQIAIATPVVRPRVPDRTTSFAVDATWPHTPSKFEAAAVAGISVDSKDRVWVFNRSKNPVQVYDKNGTFIKSWDKEFIKEPHYLRFDNQGNVWTADVGNHTVRKFTEDGKLLLTLGTPGELGSDEHHFNQPTDVAITPSGEIFVSDGYGNSRVVHFDSKGKFVKAWGKLGSGPGEFDIAHSIVADKKGLLYVADRNNSRIQVFNQDGKFLSEWDNLIVPFELGITAQDEIWVNGAAPKEWTADETRRAVPAVAELLMKFDLSGKALLVWAFPMGQKPGEVDLVHAMAVDSERNVYIGDINGKRAQKFIRKN